MHYYRTAIRQQQASILLNRHYHATKENILGDGLKLCRRAKAFSSDNPDTAFIEVSTRKNKRVANMVDVAHCGNAHLCAHCSALKSAHMKNWITELLLPAVKSHHLCVGLLTLTASHRRDSDWSAYAANFFLASNEFRSSMKYYYKALGSLGRVRTMESPVGANGLHLHFHDLFTYLPGADIEAFRQAALTKWKAACKKYGLKCNSHGVDVQSNGDFDATYIAKDVAAEMASHDSKTLSKRDLKTLFQLLDQSHKGDTQAGSDWIRAAKAIQGRDRWNVGQLADKLGILCPSEWRKPKGTGVDEDMNSDLISYPQAHHMIATSPSSKRNGLSQIQRAALNEYKKPGNVPRIVLLLCNETIKSDIETIKQKHARKLSYRLVEATTQTEKDRALTIQTLRCNFEIEDYELKAHACMFPAPVALPLVPVVVPDITYDLDFS